MVSAWGPHPIEAVDLGTVAPIVHELLATEAALDKLGARDISDDEAEQLPANRHADLPPTHLHHSPGNPDARLSIRLTVEGDNADKLRRIAHARGQRPSDVVAELLRSA